MAAWSSPTQQRPRPELGSWLGLAEGAAGKAVFSVLHAGGMETTTTQTAHKGLNPEAGWSWTGSQVATWSVAPRPAQAPPPPRPSACRLRPLPPVAPSSFYLHKEAAPRPAQGARDPGEAEGTC